MSNQAINTLQQPKESVKLVRKANDLVEARYKFNIWEMRIFTKMLTMIRKDDEDFKEYRIYLKEVINDFNLQKDNASYEWLKDGATRLLKKIITVVRQTEEGEKEFQTPIIAGVDSFLDKRKAKYIDISFHPKMKPYLLQLKSQFLMYDVRNILLLQSMYSIRLYELLKQYEKIGWRRIQVQELKEMMGIENQYKLYGHFKARVIHKAQKDLKKYCDIRFEFEEEKKGRKINSIVFHIFSNDPNAQKKTKKAHSLSSFHIPPNWGITNKTTDTWIQQYGIDALQQAIQYTQTMVQQTQIDNPGGYLYSILKKGLVTYSGQTSKKQKAAKKKQLEAERKRALDLEIKISNIKREKSHKEYNLIDEIFKANSDIREQVFQAAKNSRFSGYDTKLTAEENYQNNPIFRVTVLKTVKSQFPKEFAIIESKFINALEKINFDSLSFDPRAKN